MAAVLVLGMASCSVSAPSSPIPGVDTTTKTQIEGQISEVAPPEVIQQLSPALDVYQPQITIISPKQDEILQDNNVEVRFQVEDLPIFKNPSLDLGPHLHVILDNQPYIAVYDIEKPLVLEDVAPGTHTLRVFASRPWDESFKNEGAYAQATFHIFLKTTDNNPSTTEPLLTYSSPKGSYGAEPILLDFYLTNAPLHLVAQENPEDEIADWRIRVTVNGESFVIGEWQPLYLKGFRPGKNWVRLEFIDRLGNPVKNVFNDTVRTITYQPNGTDTLSKLVRGEISVAEARGIVEPNYTPGKPEPTPTPEEATPTPTPNSTLEATPSVVPSPIPTVEESPTTAPVTPSEEPIIPAQPEPKQPEKPKPSGIFIPFRRPVVSPSPSPTPQLTVETPASVAAPSETKQPEQPGSQQPIVSPSPSPTARETVETPTPTQPTATEAPTATSTQPIEETPASVAVPSKIKEPEQPQPGNIFSRGWSVWRDRFSRLWNPAASPSPSPTLPEIIKTPTAEPVAPELPLTPPEPLPQPEVLVTPPPANPIEEPTATEPSQSQPSPSSDRFNFLEPPAVSPSLPPTLPEILPTPTSEPVTPPEMEPAPEQTPVLVPLEKTPQSEPTNAPEPEVSSEQTPAVPLEETPQSKPTGEVTETPNHEPAVTQPTSTRKFPIIEAPASTDVPSSLLEELTKDTPAPSAPETKPTATAS